jgi:hypothetical protein
VHYEREAALAAEILDIESYVVVRMRLPATIDFAEYLLDVAVVATGFPPDFPRGPLRHDHGCVFDDDHTSLPQAVGNLFQQAIRERLGLNVTFLGLHHPVSSIVLAWSNACRHRRAASGDLAKQA